MAFKQFQNTSSNYCTYQCRYFYCWDLIFWNLCLRKLNKLDSLNSFKKIEIWKLQSSPCKICKPCTHRVGFFQTDFNLTSFFSSFFFGLFCFLFSSWCFFFMIYVSWYCKCFISVLQCLKVTCMKLRV